MAMIRTCDICNNPHGDSPRDARFKVKMRNDVYIWNFGDSNYDRVDICEDCLRTIKNVVRWSGNRTMIDKIREILGDRSYVIPDRAIASTLFFYDYNINDTVTRLREMYEEELSNANPNN